MTCLFFECALKGQNDINGDTISNKKAAELKEEYPEMYEYVENLYQELTSVPVSYSELKKAFENIISKKS